MDVKMKVIVNDRFDLKHVGPTFSGAWADNPDLKFQMGDEIALIPKAGTVVDVGNLSRCRISSISRIGRDKGHFVISVQSL
jgi:hypothetical protein